MPGTGSSDAVSVLKKSRLKIEFTFYNLLSNHDEFTQIWAVKNMLGRVEEN